jgi:beta-lactamase regulating signal transducer with metallopeptidase domain
MHSFIESTNQWGANFLKFAWPMLWQSSLLITALFALKFLFLRKLRASIRYALWLVVLVKLCVPPTLALPTSPAWWLHQTPPPVVAKPAMHYTVTYDSVPLPSIPQTPLPVFVPPTPVINLTAWLLISCVSISSALFLWLLVRWWQITRQDHRAKLSGRLTVLVDEAQKIVGTKFKVQAKLTTNTMSPAVCGLFRPVILIPQSLTDNFSDEQLRAVLLHELIHLRRRDVWVNFLQALLQIFYWWHPLVWLANARIRRVREEAVDDAVMLALRDQADSYAPTLLEVAKLALNRPLASLGLVGIMESRHALRQRIERLVDFHPPRHAGVTLVSLLGILAFTAVAVPMGGAPTETNNSSYPNVGGNLNQTNSSNSTTASVSNGKNTVQNWITVTFKINDSMRQDKLKKLLQDSGVKIPPTVYFYMDNGILLVRGSKEQVALVNRAVLKLNGYSPKDLEAADRRFISQFAAAGSADSSATNLFERSFKVDTLVFGPALQKAIGLQTINISMMAKSFFSQLGVDWESPAGKAVFYNDRLGLLFVKATNPDLDTIERAIQASGQVTPQIHIKARFLEVPMGTVASYGSFLNLTNSTTTNQFTGILNATNAKMILNMLESRDDVETLAEPEITTTSGRQVEIRVTTILTVITNCAFEESLSNSAALPQNNYSISNNSSGSIVFQTEKVESGPILDVVPYVLSDGYTIYLALIPSFTEFLGYDTPTNTTATYDRAGEKIDVPKISPHFRIRQVVATVNLWDGQTVVLGGLPEATHFGGSAVIGKTNTIKKDLLVFVTAEIVDPAGKRVHSDDDLPFAQKGAPPQPPPPQPPPPHQPPPFTL